MDYKDYYKLLGLTRTATEKEIKTAYKKLARKYHPAGPMRGFSGQGQRSLAAEIERQAKGAVQATAPDGRVIKAAKKRYPVPVPVPVP